MKDAAIITLSMKEKKAHPAFICNVDDAELLIELLNAPNAKEKIRYLDAKIMDRDSTEAALRYLL